jgi:hypothetical protein
MNPNIADLKDWQEQDIINSETPPSGDEAAFCPGDAPTIPMARHGKLILTLTTDCYFVGV